MGQCACCVLASFLSMCRCSVDISVHVLVSSSHFRLQIGLYSISFGFAWGPIGWLVPSEIHDLNTRSAGQSITVFTQLVSGAVVTQSAVLPHFFVLHLPSRVHVPKSTCNCTLVPSTVLCNYSGSYCAYACLYA